MLRLSVIIPVYNVEDCLADCLDSILGDASADAAQGWQVEVIAVDDCSTDSSLSILDAYAAFDTRLRLLRTERNSGSGPARNLGFAHATGDYVWFVDADDVVVPGAIGHVLRRLSEATGARRPDVLLVGHEKIDDEGRPAAGNLDQLVATAPMRPATSRPGEQTRPGEQINRSRGLLRPGRTGVSRAAPARQCPTNIALTGFALSEWPEAIHYTHTPWTKIVRRRFLADTGLTFPSGWYTDLPWTYGLLVRAARIAVLPSVVYRWRQRRSGSITRTQDRRHFEVFTQWERTWSALPETVPQAIRRELFARMAWHLLLVAGNNERIRPRDRRAFFRRAARLYRRYLPPEGYPIPGGVNGLKQRILASGSYSGYALTRLAWRTWNGLRPQREEELAPPQQTSHSALGRPHSRPTGQSRRRIRA
ncbi:glycosyltransferase [Natronoglycomyces albus]|uniref:Glycosyltransferase n=1 Tax=Natronoglycomyces albus TaxID=2811108 RepID=A0A895XVW4_9ACTN|nr:glycosyltransferase family 2 protein [Natronoglycomyces albus]QSB05778.1 glycosyltransferase [Natronoglycomyces albus]